MLWRRLRAWLFPGALLILVALSGIAAELAFLPAGLGARESIPPRPSGTPAVLRLHVIANSDSAEDQRVKRAVRDAILREFAPATSLAEAEQIVLASGGALQAAVDAVLQENGCDYGAQLVLGVCAFPTRSYGAAIYPAGDYEALRVVLGRGAGQNWWCVLFPPLCIIEEGSETIPGDERIVFESKVLDWLRGD